MANAFVNKSKKDDAKVCRSLSSWVADVGVDFYMIVNTTVHERLLYNTMSTLIISQAFQC